MIVESFALAFAAIHVVATVATVAAGELPVQTDAANVTRITWVSADRSDEHQSSDCVLTPPRGWTCPAAAAGDAGVVVVEGDTVLAFVVVGEGGAIASGTAGWGRLIRVAAPAGTIDGLAVDGLRVVRPANRLKTRTLDVMPEPDIEVWPASASAFWLAGQTRSTDVFIRATGAGAAAHDEPLERVLSDGAQIPLTIRLESPTTLGGRVESQSGEIADAAIVDLFALLPTETSVLSLEALKLASVVRTAETHTDASGQFEFPGLEPRQYKVVVSDFVRGRGEVWTDTAAPPLLIRLKAPATLTGRVLRQRLPAPGVTVRFIPDSAAWRESTDASAHLTADASTDDAGRFVLTLPPVADGAVQFTAPDGASKRIRLPLASKLSEIALGDIALDDPIAVEVRTDVPGCVLSAAGPAGGPGFSIVRAESNGIVHVLKLPEPGQWLMQVECEGVQRRVSPPGIEISETGLQSPATLRILD